MKVEATIIKENEDGSADLEISLDEEGKTFLINFAFVEMLKKAIDEGKKYTPKPDEGEVEINVVDSKDFIQKKKFTAVLEDDAVDSLVVQSLKDAYEATFLSMWHPEDIKYNKDLRKALKVVLSYYMITDEHEQFISMMEQAHNDDE